MYLGCFLIGVAVVLKLPGQVHGHARRAWAFDLSRRRLALAARCLRRSGRTTATRLAPIEIVEQRVPRHRVERRRRRRLASPFPSLINSPTGMAARTSSRTGRRRGSRGVVIVTRAGDLRRPGRRQLAPHLVEERLHLRAHLGHLLELGAGLGEEEQQAEAHAGSRFRRRRAAAAGHLPPRWSHETEDSCKGG